MPLNLTQPDPTQPNSTQPTLAGRWHRVSNARICGDAVDGIFRPDVSLGKKLDGFAQRCREDGTPVLICLSHPRHCSSSDCRHPQAEEECELDHQRRGARLQEAQD